MKLFKSFSILRKSLIPFLKRLYANELNSKNNKYSDKDIYVSPFYFIELTSLSPHVRLYGRGIISRSSVDSYTYIHTGTSIAYADIGKFCSIAKNTVIAQGEHPINFISTHPIFYSPNAPWSEKMANEQICGEHGKVKIGNDVWIGVGCYIKDGIKIGNGCIIAAGSVVVKDVPDYAIVGGIPAKIIKFRFSDDIICQLLKLKWWDYDVKILKEKKVFFQQAVTDDAVKSLIENFRVSK